ncbi:MAG: hypothetical protein OEY89_12220 [Gammaproteobacteria bacterium]|nr:hypothetical protein [Gammaproteobacteria bacterium]
MKISEKKKMGVFSAISDPIMDLRLSLKKSNLSRDEIDDRLFAIQLEIHKRLIKALNLTSNNTCKK